jgi:hypothetical protein
MLRMEIMADASQSKKLSIILIMPHNINDFTSGGLKFNLQLTSRKMVLGNAFTIYINHKLPP